MMRYHSVVFVLLCAAVCTHSLSLMVELSATSIADMGMERHLPVCFNAQNTYHLEKGKLVIKSESPFTRNRQKRSSDSSDSDSESSRVKKFSASDLYPNAGDAPIESLYITNTSLVAVGIPDADAACVLDENFELMGCIDGASGSRFGTAVHIDEANQLLVVTAPKMAIFYASQRHGNHWKKPEKFFVRGANERDALGTGLACVQGVCAFGAPQANEGSGEIHLMQHDSSGINWAKLCTLPSIDGIEQLGGILRAIAYTASPDIMLLQTSGCPETTDVLLPIMYKVALDGSNCKQVLPEINFAVKDSYVCSVEDSGSVCIDRLYTQSLLPPSTSSSSSE